VCLCTYLVFSHVCFVLLVLLCTQIFFLRFHLISQLVFSPPSVWFGLVVRDPTVCVQLPSESCLCWAVCSGRRSCVPLSIKARQHRGYSAAQCRQPGIPSTKRLAETWKKKTQLRCKGKGVGVGLIRASPVKCFGPPHAREPPSPRASTHLTK